MDWCILETEGMVLLEFVTTHTEQIVPKVSNHLTDTLTELQKSNFTTLPSALNIATGYTVSSDMRRLAQDIGHVGMERPQNNFALVVYFIMKILMLVIGLKMLPVVKNIHYAKTMQMVTSH